MFISDNITYFFGRRIKVLNFSRKKYLNKKAQKRYRSNYKELMNGKLDDYVFLWPKYVILGLRSQEEFDEIIKITNSHLTTSFYTYVADPTLDFSKKQENFKVIYVSFNGTESFDNTVYVNKTVKDKCPKFRIKRPCDTCMKCAFMPVTIPTSAAKYLL